MAARGVQGHLRLARVGNPVDDLFDFHAAARGLILDPALRYTVAQGGAGGRVPHCRQCAVIRGGKVVLPVAPAFPGAVARFPAGQEARTLPSGGAGPAGALPAGASAIIYRSKSASVSPGGGPHRRLGVPAS